MFYVKDGENGELILSGRLDASQADKARDAFDRIHESKVLDFRELEYISSLGLGILFSTQMRLSEEGHKLKLVNLSAHIRDIFRYTSFDKIFEIE
jgi:anti-sigma B factor antagonist